MTNEKQIAAHYRHGGLLEAIRLGLDELGLSPDAVTIDDLGPVDEFHIGGRRASAHFLDQLGIRADMKVLDIGCGLGGGARFTAATYGAHVTGIDLTPEYIEAGQALCGWCGLTERVTLREGSALSMPFPDGHFDSGYMMHVGMNIEAKSDLFSEAHRVLAPHSKFGVYDIMRTGGATLIYPVPWAADGDTSWLAEPADYRQALSDAGFDIVTESSRRDFALEFFRGVQQANEKNGSLPPLGLHTLMGGATTEKVGNMVANISAGTIAPFEIIVAKR